MSAYYNEIDPYAAQWLRNLIAAGHIADGEVDTRSISEVEPYDLQHFTQCHFFAGIGVWSRALRISGWADERPVWTGSCPCQPFSAAGLSGGFTDERHLWPHWHHLIRECRPEVVFGEQVASKDGLGWLDLVQADMEGEDYAFAAFDLCAAGVGAPHIRQRLWFVGENLGRSGLGRVGNPHDQGLEGHRGRHSAALGHWQGAVRSTAEASELDGLANAERDEQRSGRRAGCEGQTWPEPRPEPGGCGAVDGLDDGERAGPTNGFWRDADWLFCRDGKWRPVEPGAFPLAHGTPGRVGRLRAYGNAITAQVASQVIQSYLEARP